MTTDQTPQHGRLGSTYGLTCTVLAFLLAFLVGANGTAVAAGGPTKVTGTVVRVSSDQMTLEQNGSMHQYTITDNARVVLNDKSSPARSIKSADKVTVYLNSSGAITRIYATSPPTAGGFPIWLAVLIALAVLALLGLLWFLLRRGGRNVARPASVPAGRPASVPVDERRRSS